MIIVAGPTTGKTTLARALLAQGIPYVEGDEWLKSEHPKEWDTHAWRNPTRKEWLRVLDAWEALTLREDETKVVLTSMWTVRMLEAAMAIVWRLPTDVVALSESRGDSDPLTLLKVRDWYADIAAGVRRADPASAPELTILRRDQFLSDYLARQRWFTDATGFVYEGARHG